MFVPVMGIWFVGVRVSCLLMCVLMNVTRCFRIAARVFMFMMCVIMLVAVCVGLFCVHVLMLMLFLCQQHGSKDHQWQSKEEGDLGKLSEDHK